MAEGYRAAYQELLGTKALTQGASASAGHSSVTLAA
jgi:hypothetical protein